MNVDPVLIVELLALGVVVGFLAGLLGIGGGMMMVPTLTWLLTQRGVETGHAVKMAIASAMATIAFTSLSSVRAHHRLGAVRWDVARSMSPGIIFGGLLAGAGAFAVFKGRGLALLFALFLTYMAVQMLLDRKPRPGRQLPGPWGCATAGSVIGFVSGLVGAGGAFLSTPFMTWCNLPPRHAVGTSAALGFPIAVSSTLGYVVSGWSLPSALPGAQGYLYLPALVLVSLTSVFFAPWGARTAHRINVKRLKQFFALLLLGLAASMLHRAFSAQ
jgi:uncharacterized protein